MADGAQTAESVWASPHTPNHLTLYADREEIVSAICERLAQGEPLAVICRDSQMPSYQTVYEWIAADEKIGGAIAYGRAQGYDAIARDTLLIADGKKPSRLVQPDGTEIEEHDATRDKLRVDTRLKLLAKWDPKRYGDSVQLKHADADGKKLDTAPLVAELMGLLGAGSGVGLDALNVTPSRAEDNESAGAGAADSKKP